MPIYVYGIMRACDATSAAQAAAVETVEHGELGALVRAQPDGELRLRRDTILAHAEVLQTALEHGPVLPLRLGTALPDPDAAVRELLVPRADALARRLDALEGKAEMQVKATYAEEPLLRSILDRDPPLRRAVDEIRRLPAAATHFQQIRIGEAIAQSVQARRTVDGQTLLGALRPLALAVSESAPHHERAVLNAAFLVESGGLARFDGTVEQLSQDRAPEIEFKLIGPLPAYSFADGGLEAPAGAGSAAGWV